MAEAPAPEGHMNGGGTAALFNTSEPVGSKRQRRPSVRLGDIGDQPSDSHPRRSAKPWRFGFPNSSGKPSKTRPLTNLTPASDFGETLEGDEREPNDTDVVLIGGWRVSDSKKRGSSVAKRPRSNWLSYGIVEGEDVDDGYREFNADNSGSPIQSWENFGDDERHDFDGEDGVRIWLNGLGLGRYAPVFRIHEVDDEVLPLLTLEDLKDMGINAVGSRRKMYCAIQKLGKGFS